MLYAIIATDVPTSGELRSAARSRHLAYIEPLVDQGRVVLAGPLPAVDSDEPWPAGVTGSLIVAEFDSLEDAEQWVEADPYAQEGVFASVTIKPFIQVLP